MSIVNDIVENKTTKAIKVDIILCKTCFILKQTYENLSNELFLFKFSSIKNEYFRAQICNMQQTFKYMSFLFILSLNTFTSLSQSKISGKIIDSDANTPLASTQITNFKTGISINANLNGTFQNLETGTYLFQKESALVHSGCKAKGQDLHPAEVA